VPCQNEVTAEMGVAVFINHDEVPMSCDGGLDHGDRGHHVLRSGLGHSAGAAVIDGSLISFLNVSVGVPVADALPHHSVAPRVRKRHTSRDIACGVFAGMCAQAGRGLTDVFDERPVNDIEERSERGWRTTPTRSTTMMPK